MGRAKRAADGGLVYHVLNRANARMTIFEKPEDYAAFLRVLEEALQRTRTRLLACCVMPGHWHRSRPGRRAFPDAVPPRPLQLFVRMGAPAASRINIWYCRYRFPLRMVTSAGGD